MDPDRSIATAVFYFSDDGELMAVRHGDWKFVFAMQTAHQMNVWAQPLVKLRVPHMFNLRRDPFELANFNSNTYFDWMVDHVPQLYAVQALVAQQIAGSSHSRRARSRLRSTWTR